ncbi:hypothetical protein V2J09_003515 [Rumex salicifolius]
MRVEKVVGTLRSKLARSVKMVRLRKTNRGEKSWSKIEKTESTRVEMASRKARRLIEETLRVADSPSTRTLVV